MFVWTRRLFASWREFFEYLVFLGVCVTGILHASLLWVVVAAMVLLLLGWDRYRELFAKAGRIDAEYRALAQLARENGHFGISVGLYARARMLLIVLGAKIGHDCLFTAGAYTFGVAAGWFWGVP